MDSYRGGDLTIAVVDADAPPRVFLGWEGKSNERDPRRTLGAFLVQVVAHAKTRRASVELHLQKVTSINSSTIGCLVELIRAASVAAVPLVLRYDATVTWQRLSFEALGVLAKGDRGFTLETI
jgi:hypothetical protein